MNTITPIPIIIPTHTEPNRCPKCGKPEDIKKVCRHCGAEYREDDLTGKDILCYFVLFLIVVWIACTLGFWLLEQGSLHGPPTLFEVLKAQVQFFAGLRIW